VFQHHTPVVLLQPVWRQAKSCTKSRRREVQGKCATCDALLLTMRGFVVQGAKLPVDRRPSSPAPPVYQEEFETFFNCEGTDPSGHLSGRNLLLRHCAQCLTLLITATAALRAFRAASATVLHCVLSLTHLHIAMIPATFTYACWHIHLCFQAGMSDESIP